MLDIQVCEKVEIINILTEWIKTTYPNRTTEYGKCSRDIELVVDAILRDLENNTTSETQYIANKFWSRSEPMLKNNFVELQVYDKLATLLNNISTINVNHVPILINIVKNTIQNGPLYQENSWEKLFNKRIMTFNWTDQIPEKRLIDEILHEMHEFCPSKQRRVRYNIDVVPNYLNVERKLKIYAGTIADPKKINSRYNPQVLAPWLLSFSVNYDKNNENRDIQFYENEAWLDIGLALQQIMLSSLTKELDVGLCACIQNKEEIKTLLGRKPVIYVGIGYKNPDDEYYCPIKKRIVSIPGRDFDQKPALLTYVNYLN